MNALTYPARPVSAGLNTAKPFDWQIPGEWWFEPKVNGWRALVYVPERKMWNRIGGDLTIASDFSEAMDKLEQAGIVWADCEALERRHNIGRGSLILLDVLWHKTYGVMNMEQYWQRRQVMRKSVKVGESVQMLKIDASNCGPKTLFVLPAFLKSDAAFAWEQMKIANKTLGVPFWEGFVAKRIDSTYPLQLRNPDAEFKGWVKKRFLP